MKRLKLAFIAIAGFALLGMVNTSTSSATELTSPSGTMVSTGTVMKAESEGEVVLDTPIGKTECASSTEAQQSNTGGAESTVTWIFLHIVVTPCKNGFHVTVILLGVLEIHRTGSNVTVTWSGGEVTLEGFGAHCIFKAENTDIGLITTGSPATFDVSGSLPRSGGRSGALCGSSVPITGSYKVTAPNPLFVD